MMKYLYNAPLDILILNENNVLVRNKVIKCVCKIS